QGSHAAALTAIELVAGCSGGSAPVGSAAPGEVDAGDPAPLVERDVAVPMRDGVILRADVYRPGGPGRFPVLVYRTPYGKAAAAESYETHLEAVARGYAVVLQDVRGRYESDGEFDPYRNEGDDGYDTIEWAAAQAWSNGVVGTYGLSYPGAVQWLAALESPPHLEAMAPAMTFSSPRNFFYMNGVFDLSWLPWIYLNIAPDTRDRLDLPGITSSEQAEATWPRVADEYRSYLPLSELPYLRDAAPYYYEWLRHPPEDPWWDWAEIRGRYGSVDDAVLNLSGWFDEAYGPEGAVTNFNGLLDTREAGNLNTHLVLGPWTHGVGSTESRETGAIDFGPAAAIDYDDLVLDFFDHYLKGIENRFAAGPPVRYFVMGANHWEETVSWPPTEAQDLPLYLGSAEALGRDAPVPEGPSSSSFVADPVNPVVDPYASFGPRDYRALAGRDDLLIFETAPLGGELTIAGPIEAVVYASCDCRDFDLWVRVFDVHPDGRAINLMGPGNDMLRASYRNPAAGRRLLTPERVYELRLPNLLTSNRFAAGHRLRIHVSASFAPHFSRNLQTGESEIVSSESKPARITIHHSPEHPSRILLPVTRP
ncbi:MAG TPA: CocE/NonD family hydrolase, partial [Woeseiaceae bacterium]|nr:CocE/NonD family hydrolase [Woeseiaceae bacterium]